MKSFQPAILIKKTVSSIQSRGKQARLKTYIFVYSTWLAKCKNVYRRPWQPKMWLLIYQRFWNGWKKNNILKCFRWPIFCMVIIAFLNIILLKNSFSSSYLENAMRSAMKWKAINNQIMQWGTVNRIDEANLLSKHFWVRITIQNTKIFFVGQPWWLSFFGGLFFARGHWISNLNSDIGRGHEVIIAFEENSIGPMEFYWCLMTTRSCNFERSQCRKFPMGYDYEIRQQVHLSIKNPLDTSCQLLVT